MTSTIGRPTGQGAAFLAFLLALLVAFAAPTRAAMDEEGYRELNRTLIEDFVLPEYAALAEAAAAFQSATGAVCGQRDTEGVAQLREAYQRLAGAWQRVAHLRFGPSQLLMRSMRYSFWPDPKDAVGDAVDDMVGALDARALIEEEIRNGSVAGQGLPALERLLYGDEAEAAFIAEDAAGQFRCAYVAALSDNLAYMAADLVHEWGDTTTGFAAELLAAGDDPDGHYLSQREVTLELFKAFFGAIELMADHKLAKPLGDTIDSAQPRLAEAWRSDLSMAHIRANLTAAATMYLMPGGIGDTVREKAGDVELDALLRKAFAQIEATARSIERPLQLAVVDPDERTKVEKLALETRALKALFVKRLAPALGIPVGFNGLDGD